nr:Rne/Rng family ribonuclease [Tissierella sp.]
MNTIFIDSDEEKNHIAIVEEETLVEYFIESKSETKTLGNIYRARVENVLKGMEAAFVNIGEAKNAYLYLTDAMTRGDRFSDKEYSINDLVKTGDEVIVQVIKEALGSKGAKITTNLSISGRNIVITPFQKGINISKKIKSKEAVNLLKSIGDEFKGDNVGVIFRTAAGNADRDIIIEEYKHLLASYKYIESQRNFLPTPKLIYKEAGLVEKIVRDNFNKENYQIVVNTEAIYYELLELEEKAGMELKGKLILDKDLDFKYNSLIQKGLTIALSRSVKLKSGGSIVIDQTEALTAIDVNTYKYVGSTSFDSTIINTNIEAAEEIARQIKLRNIGGIIIIDFIDMISDGDNKDLMNALEKYFRRDKNKPYIVDITKLGLVEVTRKKERPTLEREMMIKCSACEGRGRIR